MLSLALFLCQASDRCLVPARRPAPGQDQRPAPVP